MAYLFIDCRLSQCISMATLTSAAARASDNFEEHSPNKGKKAGIIIGLCILTLLSNICGVRVSTQLSNITTSRSVYLASVLLELLPLGAEGSRATTQYLSTTLEDS